MATTAPVKKAWRSLAWLLVIIVALIGANAFGVIKDGATWTPQLALDLEGGTQIVLAPTLEDGQSVSGEQLTQAVSIIRQRVDASGVSEAEITTQGNQNIVVSLPGTRMMRRCSASRLRRSCSSVRFCWHPRRHHKRSAVRSTLTARRQHHRLLPRLLTLTASRCQTRRRLSRRDQAT